MDVLTAHELCAGLDPSEREDLLPGEYHLETSDGERADCWPAIAVGLVVRVGWLASCETEADLREAVRHGRTLLDIGCITAEEVEAEAMAVIGELLRWGPDVEGAGFAAAAGWN